jgi:MFS transporter, YQGE family, putative transporter
MKERIKNSNLARLLISHNTFYFGRAFLDVFLNILIWDQTSDIKLVALFNIGRLVAHCSAFFIFGQYVKGANNTLVKNIGLFNYAFAALLISLFKEFFLSQTLILGLMMGLFNGMYWINYQTIRFDLTNKLNRAKYVGWENGLKIVSGIVIPIIGGALLAYLPVGLGFYSLLFSTIILVTVALFAGNYHTEQTAEINRVDYWHTFKMIFTNREILKAQLSSTLGGFVRRGAFLAVLIPLYIYLEVENEFKLGNILAFISGIAAISYIVLGSRIKYQHYRRSLLIGIFLQIVSIAIVLISPGFVSFVIYSIIQKISLPFSEIPRKVIITNLIHKLPNYKNHRVEYIAINELFSVGFGWTSSYFILLFFQDVTDPVAIKILLTVMIVFIAIELLLLLSIKPKHYQD